ncbi:ABC transporter permease [Acetobacter thailandicus]|uniref:ABC transporter permease n=1 Tax=Acetobacter thailandicus TaxID=1502842 RepID=A0ABT3QHD2_9PROT|nr:ABC transporter permease [Acetobacter thailandicus]MCX2564697.1 ABC transporter permease [Acetobacter thailandicus]NHN96271.1 ABC transporter permease [Acetobacter thailandicus]
MSELAQPEAHRRYSAKRQSTLTADKGWMQRFGLVWSDLQEGAKLYRLVWTLACSDIKLRYRGSLIGPFWLTLSTAIQIGAMAFLYADLFHTDIHTYIPFLAVSLVLWGYLSSLTSDGCICFSAYDTLIKGTRMPFIVHVVRSVIRNTIILLHNVVVIVAVFVLMGKSLTFYSLAAIPGFLLWLIDGVAISFLLGTICARFRDIPQIVAAIMQVAFFMTPIMWQATTLRGHPGTESVVLYNPFVYILDVVRNPLLNEPLSALFVMKALVISGLLVLVSLVSFARFRGRISFWV